MMEKEKKEKKKETEEKVIEPEVVEPKPETTKQRAIRLGVIPGRSQSCS